MTTPMKPGSPAYHVVALSMPTVYTLEGDHDPNGLLFTLKAYQPLLEWARAVWEADGDYLPLLHERRQRIQLVVDGLRQLGPMIERLRHGPDDDQDLLAELIRSEHLAELGESEDRLRSGPRIGSPRSGAVRANVERVVDDLRFALEQLGAVPEVTDARGGAQPPLASLGDAERAALLTYWTTQSIAADAAVETWFARFEADPARRFDADALAAASGLAPDRVRRLMLNDHRLPWSGSGSRPPAYDRFNPLRPIPVVRPLVLRARQGEPIVIRFENGLTDRRVGFHVQGDGTRRPGRPEGVRAEDGSHIGLNQDSTVAPGGRRDVRFAVRHEGVWPINDLADVRGTEAGSNVHGLFGTLVVEAAGSTWRDPETGDDLTFTADGDGLYVDVIAPGEVPGTEAHLAFIDFHSDDVPRSFREFTVFLHDEPEVHSGLHTSGEHSIMPISYRAEPMPNRLPHRMRRLADQTPPDPPEGQAGIDFAAVRWELGDELDQQFWTARAPDGRFLERVAGEEQHHSSWLFGEPITPVLRAYRGDPCRVRLVHAGVKETHVFHLHVHQWRAIPQDTAPASTWGSEADGTPKHQGSQLLDSITIGPQTGVTIDPLYGSGSRQRAVGDIIWHCHLYPHFHHGMWGLWRSLDREVADTTAYPDGTPCPALLPLPGRPVEPPSAEQPGYPWFVDATYPRKSPPPPVLRPQDVGGRRCLLQMPLHNDTELAAFAEGCRLDPKPGALFVDLDGDARRWNAEVGLPPPRIVSYDVEVLAGAVTYNRQGWHDPVGHHYRLLAAEIRQTHPDGTETLVESRAFEHPPGRNPEPFFPRANHGDIVELRLHNTLTSFPADQFDLAQLPVECGLHVHLVKFDPLAADGSSTGWNYLSGASCREAVGSDHPGQPGRTVSLHRWVVDEEFGPCFFHDHLLANFRQKHGLFAALVAEPHGSQWTTVDQEATAWADPQAVVLPPIDSGLPPYRDACLAVADFVTLLDEGGRALNPPGEPSGDDDPGSMAVNYRSAPMTFRGPDPSTWFSTEHDPVESGSLPDTPTIRTYPGERLRIRLIQGSHEEQHGFTAHGLRWHREWHHPGSTLVDQQTLGISEAFTLDIDPAGRSPYGPGDHLWRFSAIDDTWLGCWGLVRALPAGAGTHALVPPLPVLDPARPSAPVRAVPPRPDADDPSVRTVVVVARRAEHRYAGDQLTDPWGLAYQTATYDAAEHDAARESGEWLPQRVDPLDGPMVLRARRGEWVRVFLVNELVPDVEPWEQRLPTLDVEPSPPVLPLEHVDELGRPDRRSMTARVSLHPHLLRYDVHADDGAHVGTNRDGTVAALDRGRPGHEGGGPVERNAHPLGHRAPNWTEHWWYADEALAPASHLDGPGQVCLLEDLADVRNHRHHGLFGALVVLPGDVTPSRWSGPSAELRAQDDTLVATEAVLFVQDGLRLFVGGHPDQPVVDVVPGDDPEDSGQKAISYRSTPILRGRAPHGHEPGSPVLSAVAGHDVWLRVLGAGDKPRNHSLTVHGAAWEEAPWVQGGPWTGAESGVGNGWARTLLISDVRPGDHAVRTGAFRWGTELGVWGLLRVPRPS